MGQAPLSVPSCWAHAAPCDKSPTPTSAMWPGSDGLAPHTPHTPQPQDHKTTQYPWTHGAALRRDKKRVPPSRHTHRSVFLDLNDFPLDPRLAHVWGRHRCVVPPATCHGARSCRGVPSLQSHCSKTRGANQTKAWSWFLRSESSGNSFELVGIAHRIYDTCKARRGRCVSVRCVERTVGDDCSAVSH